MDSEVERAPRALPEDVSKELLHATKDIRNTLDDLPVEIWGGYRFAIAWPYDGATPSMIALYRICVNSVISRKWYVEESFAQSAPSLNIPMGPDDPPVTRKMIEQEAIRTFDYSRTGYRMYVYLDSMRFHRQLYAHLNGSLERAVDLIKTLEERITELELRPPEAGGPAFEEAKKHWESNIEG